ncbi:MAG: 50S ribosomal protein L23 [Deferribacterota bacterium]|nr:50S ribosomal protein L23 [Deferribacterota bacterium]
MANLYNIVKKPILTEKAVNIKEGQGKVTFEVLKDANKYAIKDAVEKLFDVKVKKVCIMNYRGKKKRFGTVVGRRSDWKKAVVTLAKGENIEFV